MPASFPIARPSVRRLVLVPDRGSARSGRGDEAVRRYRLARVRLEGAAAPAVPAVPSRVRAT